MQIFEITKSPLVSVLLPTYNRIDYLKQSIPSVISQTYRNWELIVVDDGSIDDSICFIRELNDPRIKIFRLRENKGRVVALNFGLSKCQGEYIARLDSDDIFLPRHLEISLCHLEANPTTSLVGSQMFILKDGGLSRTHDPVGEDISDNFLWGNFINNSTAIFVNSIVKEHALRYRNSACEDFDFWVSISNYGKISNLANLTSIYRMHSQQTTIEVSKDLAKDICKVKLRYAAKRIFRRSEHSRSVGKIYLLTLSFYFVLKVAFYETRRLFHGQ